MPSRLTNFHEEISAQRCKWQVLELMQKLSPGCTHPLPGTRLQDVLVCSLESFAGCRLATLVVQQNM